MNKVLVIGPNFYYFSQSLSRAFLQVGWTVTCELYDNPIHPYSRWNRIKYKFGDKNQLKEQSRTLYKEHIENVYRLQQPDLVFIINGDNLLPSSVEFMKTSSKVVIWLFDSVKRFPLCLENLEYADAVFCYEQEDIPYLKDTLNIEAKFLPQAVDLNLYYPVTKQPKSLDIVFAGDIFQSKKRQHYLNVLLANFDTSAVRIWGVYKPWYKNPWKWLTRECRTIYKNCNTTASVLNNDYNSARVVLNIHNEQQLNGANPKVYEICASGAYQICDANPYIESLFSNGEVGLYHNEEEMIEMVRYALHHDMSDQALKAHTIICQNHTFVDRVKTVLSVLNII